MMQIDWKALLDTIGVEWTDRGRNTSRGNVNIQCPYCGEDDPSKHMLLWLYGPGYYCLRDDRHKGADPERVLIRLGVERREARRLIHDYNMEGIARPVETKARPAAAPFWDKFAEAADSDACLNYLYQRGFENPGLTAARYGLRYAPAGQWAQRLLFPIKENDQVISWAGRALSSRFTPKYLMYENDVSGMVYIPRAPRETVVLVEGPMDALKIAVATEGADISAIALLGKGLAPTKLLTLQKALVSTKRVLVALDDDVHLGIAGPMVASLAALLRGVYIARLPMPAHLGDPAEMAMGEIAPWIKRY